MVQKQQASPVIDFWLASLDRCELWGFIGEINSDISYVKYQFFPAGTTFTQL